MFLAKYPARILGIGLGAALLSGVGFGAGAAQAAPAVIVKSSASEYPVGSKIDDSKTITLEAGDSVTVLTQKGTRTMKGPGTFEVGADPKSNRFRFANLTRKRAAGRSGTGAVRGADGDDAARPLNPNLYFVDVERSGTVCLYDLAEVRLWRPYSAGIATYRVTDAASGGNIDLTFDDGENVAPIDPARMALADGKQYTITGPEGAEAASITIVDLGMEYDRPEELAAVLADKGCMVQFELMAEKLAS